MQVEKESRSVGLKKEDALNRARWKVGVGEIAASNLSNKQAMFVFKRRNVMQYTSIHDGALIFVVIANLKPVKWALSPVGSRHYPIQCKSTLKTVSLNVSLYRSFM